EILLDLVEIAVVLAEHDGQLPVDVAAVASCEPGVNPRRLEREVVLAYQSRARPLVVVTKSDLVDDPELAADIARNSAPGVDVVMVSNRSGEGIDELRSLLPPGTTVAFLGASGVGKSTIVNSLAGESIQLEGEVRDGDAKGRHTTTTARLIVLGDLLVIDTPGTRALAVWEVEPGIDLAFPEITALSESCRFADCSHRDEPGCAVRAATESGEIDPERLAHWNLLLDEVTDLHRPEY
ncbi:MAG TPA: ribosome small subunit-dependent GTPase A, partial [Microthrixaceae bacterium]|nr:ribosome small subunit-dependent GTPase A [Microthrixaceae bacterium]